MSVTSLLSIGIPSGDLGIPRLDSPGTKAGILLVLLST